MVVCMLIHVSGLGREGVDCLTVFCYSFSGFVLLL